MRIGLTYNSRQSECSRAVSRSEPSVGSFALPGDDHDEEFDSPETIEALANTLIAMGHEVELLGEGEVLLERLLKTRRPELVWNIAEGIGSARSREAQVPAVLEMLGVAYTGSDPLTLAVSLDKDCAKRLVAAAGVCTPASVLFDGDFASLSESLSRLEFPVFAKPAYEGSSKGILMASVFNDRTSIAAGARAIARGLSATRTDRGIHRR